MLSQPSDIWNPGEPRPGRARLGVFPGTSPMECAAPADMMAPMDERPTSESGAPAATLPEEPAAKPFVRRPLRRRAGHRLIAGAAGGLADHVGTRPLIFRLVFVVFAFLGGIGILVYLLLWWLIPREDLPDSAAERLLRRFPDAPSWVGIALLGLGVVLLAGKLGLWDTNVLWAVLLIGLGVVLFRRDTQRGAPDDHTPPPAIDHGPNAVLQQPGWARSEEHTSELQSRLHLVCRLLLEKKKKKQQH